MTESKTIKTAKSFLEVVWGGERPTDRALLAVVDTLLAVYHETPKETTDEKKLQPPREDWKPLWDKVAKRFPDYGFYATIDPLDMGGTPIFMVGDAIDDIADITQDMRAMIWYDENLGPEYAHTFFRDFYFHWGEHARELSCYLFARIHK